MKPAYLLIATVVLLSVTWTVLGDVCSDFGLNGVAEAADCNSDNCDGVCGGATCQGIVRGRAKNCAGENTGDPMKFCCCS